MAAGAWLCAACNSQFCAVCRRFLTADAGTSQCSNSTCCLFSKPLCDNCRLDTITGCTILESEKQWAERTEVAKINRRDYFRSAAAVGIGGFLALAYYFGPVLPNIGRVAGRVLAGNGDFKTVGALFAVLALVSGWLWWIWRIVQDAEKGIPVSFACPRCGAPCDHVQRFPWHSRFATCLSIENPFSKWSPCSVPGFPDID